jgi:serine/threonine-protein kinase
VSVTAGYPAEGESIGPYRVLRRIGGGGMGVVFEAEDASLNRKVALKIISPHLAEDADFRARFTREAQAQASLDSAHVVHVYAHGVDDGCLYIAAQLIHDGDLGQMLAAYGAPPIRVGLDVMAQVAEGLADAHAVGLIHRDIKPANVLLRRRENAVHAYLSDFGIARQVGVEHTHTGTSTIGTPSYMAPELHTGGRARVETDVYSLGCLLWATLNGRAPYSGTSEFQIVTAHLEQPVPQLPADGPLATEVNRILRTAMAKDPAERYSSAADLRDDLRRARSLPDTATPVAPAEVTAARSGRRPIGVLVAGVAVLLALVAGGVAYAVSQGDDDPSADPSDPRSSSQTESPSEPSSEPTSASSATAPSDPDEQAAVASLTEALETTGGMSPAVAECTAQNWIQGAGLQEMVDAGLFDSDMNYVDVEQADLPPDIAAAASTAALSCATAQ